MNGESALLLMMIAYYPIDAVHFISIVAAPSQVSVDKQTDDVFFVLQVPIMT